MRALHSEKSREHEKLYVQRTQQKKDNAASGVQTECNRIRSDHDREIFRTRGGRTWDGWRVPLRQFCFR